MGDRANVVIRDGHGEVWFYLHWSGHSVARLVQRALRRRERWNDAPYLARIVFCSLLDGDTDGTTGLGISSGMCDNEHLITVVDVSSQQVVLRTEGGDNKRSWSFDAFCTMDIKYDMSPEELCAE
jgi:hypothetical protein